MESTRVQKRKAKNKSQTLTMGGTGEYYVEPRDVEKISQVLCAISSNKMSELLDSLFTKKELLNISRRIMIAKMLVSNIAYDDIAQKTGASKTTIKLVRESLYSNKGILSDIISKDRSIPNLNYKQDPVLKYAKNRIQKGK